MSENKYAVQVVEYGSVIRAEFTPTANLYDAIAEYARERFGMLPTDSELTHLLNLLIRDAIVSILDEIDMYLWNGARTLMSANNEPIAEHIQEMLDNKF